MHMVVEGVRLLKHFALESAYRLAARFPREGLRVLLYHAINDSGEPVAVPPRLFAQHLAALREHGYFFIHATTLAQFLRGESSLPARAVLLTFDDGYRDNLTNALPILEKYEAPAMIFLISAKLGKTLRARNGNVLPILSHAEVRSLSSHPLLTFGSHFHTHTKLTRLSSARVRDEALCSRRIIEDAAGYAISFAAYPFGDWDQRVQEAVSGVYEGCFGVTPGSLTSQSPKLALPRNAIDSATTPAMARGIAAVGRVIRV
ncbi:MAG: hypothetical protein KatS3mg100_119 [Candidatus Parcubacteria bacterium]|nr:MAG: hypothetical protein KatS3mg100_119 [Candidatus Parcubacteria bacterium]